MNTASPKELIAELIGTFTLVFIGSLAVVVAPDFGVAAPALAHGLILVGLIFAYGHISGAHFNPAVTLGILVGGKIGLPKAGLYMAVQFIGGIIAAFALVALLPEPGNYGQTTGSLTTSNVWNAAAIEIILTFFLVSVIYQVGVYGKAGTLAALAIGLTLAACIFAGGAFTGASLNPARTLGPALAAGDLSYLLPYLIGTFAGGALGGLIQSNLLKSD